MSVTDLCRHCGYSQPTDAATCPGCGRKHPVGRREAPRRLTALAGHLGLVPPAKRARWALVATGWIAACFALAATARLAMTVEDVSKELADATPPRITDLTQNLGWILVIALILCGVSVADWVRRSRSNLVGLHLEATWRSAWSLGGWALPGQRAQSERWQVDFQWRDTSTAVAPLPDKSRGRGWTRRPVSQVVMRWWAMWLSIPAVAALLVILLGDDFETSTIARELELIALATSACLIVALRSAYDVIGIVSVAQAHRAEALLRQRDDAVRTGSPRPRPEPLVVVDQELAEAGIGPTPRRRRAALIAPPAPTVSDDDLATYLADDEPGTVDLDEGPGASLAKPVTSAKPTQAEVAGAAAEADADAQAEANEPDNDVYDLSSYTAR